MMGIGGHHMKNFTLVVSDPKQEVQEEAVVVEPKGIGKCIEFSSMSLCAYRFLF